MAIQNPNCLGLSIELTTRGELEVAYAAILRAYVAISNGGEVPPDFRSRDGAKMAIRGMVKVVQESRQNQPPLYEKLDSQPITPGNNPHFWGPQIVHLKGSLERFDDPNAIAQLASEYNSPQELDTTIRRILTMADMAMLQC